MADMPGRFTDAKTKTLETIRKAGERKLSGLPEAELTTMHDKALAYDALMSAFVSNVMASPKFRALLDGLRDQLLKSAQIGALLSSSMRAVILTMDKSGIPELSKVKLDENLKEISSKVPSTPPTPASGA